MDIEQRAKELRKEFSCGGSEWGYVDVGGSESKSFFMDLAKYVEVEILKARINEARKWYNADVFPFEKTTGYAELQQQLTALEGANNGQ